MMELVLMVIILLYDAKQAVLALMKKAINHLYAEKFLLLVKQDMRLLLLRCRSHALSGYISEHDLKIAKKLPM